MDLNIIVRYAVKNPCYYERNIIPKGIMVHSTAAPGINAEDFYKTWNNPNFDSACVHAFVDDTKVLQILPWNKRGWHCGTGFKGLSGNDTHISFEICEPKGFKYINNVMVGYDVKEQEKYFRTIFDRAVDLCVMLCREYGFDPMKDIICHSEGYKLGIATNHGDVMHWFPKHGENMDSFRKAVKEKIEGKGDNEMIEKGKLNVNGKEYEIERILKDGENFIRLRDLKQAGFDIGYDEKSKVTSIGVHADSIEMEIEGEMTSVSRIIKFQENYARLRDLKRVIDVEYDNGIVKIKKAKS